MNERPLGQEWDAQADAWARWARTPGHDRHYPYNMQASVSLQDMDDAAGAVREATRALAPQGQMVAAFLANSRARPAFLHLRCRR